MTIKSELEASELEGIKTERESMRHERDAARQEVKLLGSQLSELRQHFEVVTGVSDKVRKPPTWLSPKTPKPNANHGIITTILSDLHLDEVVNPDEIGNVNSFDRRIAEIRLKRYFEKVIILARDHISNVTYDGITVMALGDTFTGEIHEELAKTNAAPLQESLDYWLDPMSAGLELLAKEFGKVHVISLAGNHGRDPWGGKSPMKQRAARNWDPFFFGLVSRQFRGDDRLTFTIPKSADAVVDIYDTTYLCTHGDQFRGGSGIAGIFSPLMLGKHRKSARQTAVGQPFDVMVMGHFHQYMPVASTGLIVNGSLKGYDEYASIMNFNYEEAQQAFWVTTPEHGAKAFHVPVAVVDRKAEGW